MIFRDWVFRLRLHLTRRIRTMERLTVRSGEAKAFAIEPEIELADNYDSASATTLQTSQSANR